MAEREGRARSWAASDGTASGGKVGLGDNPSRQLDSHHRRPGVNSATGERTYRFFEGNPVSASSANSQVMFTASNGTVPFAAHGTQNPVHVVNAAPRAAPLIMHPGRAAMAPVPYQTVVTPATPATERRIKIGGKEEYYIRPSYKKESWMWK